MQATAIQVNLGMINLNETEVTKKLAGWAAIIAVPTLIAGIYGMNFKNIPEYDLTYGYPFSLALMIVLDVVLYVWFRKIKWL
jgi:magnesium transporter